ncbi:MAG: hypothetical protein ABR923_14205 [Terracidiphilus sp.]
MANNPARRRRVLRRSAISLLWICLLAVPRVVQGANNCAWLNEATASGLLGGDSVGNVSAVVGEPTVCTFTQVSAIAKRTLRVTVEIAADAHARLVVLAKGCGTDAASLKAIGNEALVCVIYDRMAGLGERVVGRVRDQVFTITISSTLKSDSILNRDALKSRVYIAAEQVAGNLF